MSLPICRPSLLIVNCTRPTQSGETYVRGGMYRPIYPLHSPPIPRARFPFSDAHTLNAAYDAGDDRARRHRRL